MQTITGSKTQTMLWPSNGHTLSQAEGFAAGRSPGTITHHLPACVIQLHDMRLVAKRLVAIVSSGAAVLQPWKRSVVVDQQGISRHSGLHQVRTRYIMVQSP